METDINLRPAYIPVKCPVCNGFGSVNWGKAECHGCQGRGYVLIPSVQSISSKGDKEKKEDGVFK
jgi:DnaJ-class molecular chaperone